MNRPGVGTERPPRRSHLFTLRLWAEDMGDGQTEWRGEVQHVPSGETRFFRNWPSLLALVRSMLPDATTD
jgi:hypothetical protein